jgi:hypothetical protein
MHRSRSHAMSVTFSSEMDTVHESDPEAQGSESDHDEETAALVPVSRWAALLQKWEDRTINALFIVLVGVSVVAGVGLFVAVDFRKSAPSPYCMAACPKGTARLYNGICKATAWPPTAQRVIRRFDPLGWTLAEQFVMEPYREPPYLTAPPPVIDVTIGRQLFVDRFLIAATNHTTVRNFKAEIVTPRFMTSERMYPDAYAALNMSDPSAVVAGVWRNMVYGFPGGLLWNTYRSRWEFWFKCRALRRICYAWTPAPLTADSVWNDGTPVRGVRPLGKKCMMDAHTVILFGEAQYIMYVYPSCKGGLGRTKRAPLTKYLSRDGVTFITQGETATTLDASSLWYNPFLAHWEYGLKYNSWHYMRTVRQWTAPTLSLLSAQWDASSFCQQRNGAPDSRSRINVDYWSTHPDCAVPTSRSSPANWMYTDAEDPTDFTRHTRRPDVYTTRGVPYESTMLHFMSIAKVGSGIKNIQIYLAPSRDGFHHSRQSDRLTGIIAPPGEERMPVPHNYSELFMLNSPLRRVGNSIRMLVGGRDLVGARALLPGGDYVLKGTVMEYALRVDGFAGLGPRNIKNRPLDRGVLVTRPLWHSVAADRLFVNVALGSGRLCVELHDAHTADTAWLTEHACSTTQNNKNPASLVGRGAVVGVDSIQTEVRFESIDAQPGSAAAAFLASVHLSPCTTYRLVFGFHDCRRSDGCFLYSFWLSDKSGASRGKHVQDLTGVPQVCLLLTCCSQGPSPLGADIIHGLLSPQA